MNNQTTQTSTGVSTVKNDVVPSIYVASLSDYGAGRLHGVWIDANQPADDIRAEVQAMLDASPEPVAEEWAIHDYDGFGPVELGEWDSFEHVSMLARLIVEHGVAFAAWFDQTYEVEDDGLVEDRFFEAYQGCYTSLADYAQSLAEETDTFAAWRTNDYSMFQQATDLSSVWPFSCIDWDRAGRELELAGDIWTADSEDGLLVYLPD